MKKLLLVPVLATAVMVAACTASQVQTITQLIGIAVNALPAVIPFLTSNPTATQAAATAKTDFALAQTLITGYTANGAGAATTAGRISALLADANTNLSAMAAAVPTSAANQQKIASIASVLIGVGQDIIADLPSSSTSATVAHVTLPKPSVVQNEINQILAH